jgi:hypothetical protein
MYARSHSREVRVENSSGVKSGKYGGPQASSVRMLTLFGSRQTPVHLTTFLEFYLSLYFVYDS